MRLTRRGWAVAATAAVLFALAGANGPRSINAVVAPALVALLIAVVQVGLRDKPPVERRLPETGFVDETVSVEFAVGADRPFGATLDDGVGDGLVARGLPVTATVGTADAAANGSVGSPASARYELSLRRRGERRVGPIELTASGLLGLARTTFYYNDIATVLVYPRTFQLAPPADALAGLPAKRPAAGTDEFDGLREYERGDSRREIHWKASAKRPDEELLVRQYDTIDDRGTLTVGVSPGERGDGVAAAAASIVVYLLDAGFDVAVYTPEKSLDSGAGRLHRRTALAALARLDGGKLSDADAERADLVVRGAGGDVVVADDEGTVSFDQIVATDDGDRVRHERPLEGAGSAERAGGEVVA
ncbi:Uncharacterized conserved protein, DUF58 family, contains vWF domain [Natronoarchaeum philippinense]|uniref:Uncharacterized conserved protein, DUF58 family, contains vWF domain n=1 Tax=Natronoarchaeum philippinense TaxID=558529 RepID=A0A285NT99_NATPI|nr:DUF58 domain-containing protein [Natronoarchaeum philippinense]SNZ12227.1 Uncharacterized conserved protein, DUF58 family, contains vWF domain [Natronoarchaeum philippinense]